MNFKYALLTLLLIPIALIAPESAATAKNTTVVNLWPLQVVWSTDNNDLLAQHEPTPKEVRSSTFKSRWGTCKTLLAGALVGSAFGALNYATDNMLPLKLNWFFLSCVRSALVRDIIENAQTNSESVNGSMLASSAWLSDWAAYLAMRNKRY